MAKSCLIGQFRHPQNVVPCCRVVTGSEVTAQVTVTVPFLFLVRWMTKVKKNSLHPRGTKVVIYHLVGNFMLNSMQNVVSLATCAESL